MNSDRRRVVSQVGHVHECGGCEWDVLCDNDEQHCEWDGYCDECADRLSEEYDERLGDGDRS